MSKSIFTGPLVASGRGVLPFACGVAMLVGFWSSAALGQSGGSSVRPNIIIIMSDDMGYSDIGCYGSEIRTPVLDRLAEGGLRFSQFYNMARCCPTRAALLTGLHPHQAGVGHMTGVYPKRPEPWRGNLSHKAVTIAEVLRPSGYATYMCGKWHVTTRERAGDEPYNWPLQRGFERFYGTITGAGSFYDPTTLTRGNTMITPENDPEYRPSSFYYTDAINDNAVRFIADHAKTRGEQPFFLYVAHTAAHWPMHAPEETIDKYRGKYDRGYEPVRKARFERLRKLGLIHPDWRLPPQVGNWDEVDTKPGKRVAWRSTRPWSTAWMRASAGSSISYRSRKCLTTR